MALLVALLVFLPFATAAVALERWERGVGVWTWRSGNRSDLLGVNR